MLLNQCPKNCEYTSLFLESNYLCCIYDQCGSQLRCETEATDLRGTDSKILDQTQKLLGYLSTTRILLVFAARIRRMGEGTVFTGVCLSTPVEGLPHLHPRRLPLSHVLSRGYPSDWSQVPSQGYPSPRWGGYPSPRVYTSPGLRYPPQPGQDGVPLGQDRMGYPLGRTGVPHWPGLGYPLGRTGVPH